MSKNILRVAGGMMSILGWHVVHPESVLSDQERSYPRCLHLSQVIAHALTMSSNSKKVTLKGLLALFGHFTLMSTLKKVHN